VTAAKHLEARQIDARRIAGLLKTAMPSPHRAHAKVTANVTLATLKAGDTPEGLIHRVLGSRMVAEYRFRARASGAPRNDKG
jgi:hypothetical protein